MQNLKNRIIVAGSLAVDTLMYHNGSINEVFEVNSVASIAFNVRTQEHFWGGCAGNIVFNAALYITKQLYSTKKASVAQGAVDAFPFDLVGIVGNDFSEYNTWLTENKINTAHIVAVQEAHTAHAYVMSDTRGQQITFFYEGPGLYKESALPKLQINLGKLLPKAALVHIAPNSHWFMTECIEQAQAAGVPYFFDPGQAINLFNKEELTHACARAHGVFVNEYEYQRAGEIMGRELAELLTSESALQFIVITKAEKGSEIKLRNQGSLLFEPSSKAVVDPTGCGDAYRGAFLSVLHEALIKEKQTFREFISESKKARILFEHAGRSGSELAGLCLGVKGTQLHRY